MVATEVFQIQRLILPQPDGRNQNLCLNLRPDFGSRPSERM